MEHVLEIRTRSETALSGDGIVRPVGMLLQQSLCLFDAQMREPGIEEFPLGGLQPCCQLVTGNVHVGNDGLHGDAALQIAAFFHPSVNNGCHTLHVVRRHGGRVVLLVHLCLEGVLLCYVHLQGVVADNMANEA